MTVYIDGAENQTSQKDNGSLAPHSLYSAEARLPDLIFGSAEKALMFAARFCEVLSGA